MLMYESKLLDVRIHFSCDLDLGIELKIFSRGSGHSQGRRVIASWMQGRWVSWKQIGAALETIEIFDSVRISEFRLAISALSCES